MTKLEDLGYVIRDAREAKRMTQAELGNAISASRATVSLLETGGVKYPRIDMLTAIAEILNIPSATLYQLAGVTLSDSVPARMQWLTSQLDEEGNELLLELGHALLRERQRRAAMASPKSGTRKR